MPSSRTLAADLGYARATVVEAYQQLCAEGYLRARQGLATVVADVHVPTPPPDTDDAAQGGRRLQVDFRPGESDVSRFPRQAWARSFRRVVGRVGDDAFGYGNPQGRVDLRQALADYLGRSRAVHGTASAVHVVNGFSSAAGFLAELFATIGVTRIAVEDPTLFLNRQILTLAGATVVPVPLDAHGIDVGALERSGVRVVVVTPAHQYPIGTTMSPERRAELIDWARSCDGWIIEDDYDGEFRYDRQPIGALQGIDPDRVIYAGTASKSLAAGLRIGWLVVPRALSGGLSRVTHLRAGVSSIEQLVLADFIERGDLDRHLRTMRGLYRNRVVQLSERLRREVDWLAVPQAEAGLHLTCTLDSGGENAIAREAALTREETVIAAAAKAGIGLFGLGPHWFDERRAAGLVLGYSRVPEHQFPSALDRLIDFLAAH